MPKLISIKRPFARKTEKMIHSEFRNMANNMKKAEIAFTKLTKLFSKTKKELKDSIEPLQTKAILEFSGNSGKALNTAFDKLRNNLHNTINTILVDPMFADIKDPLQNAATQWMKTYQEQMITFHNELENL